MTHSIIVYTPYVLSVFTLWMMWLAGNKSALAWKVGLGNQALWLLWICESHTWGLLPLTACLVVMYVRNLLKWKKAV